MKREEFDQQKVLLIQREGKLAEGIEAILEAEKNDGVLPESAVKTLETLLNLLYEKKEALKNDRFYIAISGAMKSGKSTLLNALLFKKDVLATAVTACTAKLTIMENSDRNEVEAKFYTAEEWEEWKKAAEQEAKDNASESGISEQELADYIAKGESNRIKLGTTETVNESELDKYTAKKGELMPLVNTITIYDPEIDFKDAQIVDTPGTNDPVVMRSKVAEEYVKKADAIIYALYSGNALNDSDRAQLEDIIIKSGKDAKNLIFVVTKKDMLRKKDLSGRTYEEVFKQYFDDNLKTIEKGGKMTTDLSKCPRVFVSGEAARIAQDIEQKVNLSEDRDSKLGLFFLTSELGLGSFVPDPENFNPYDKAKDREWLLEYSGIDELKEQIDNYLIENKKKIVIDGNLEVIEYVKDSCNKEVFGNLDKEFKKKLESVQKNVAEIEEEILNKKGEINNLEQSKERIENERNNPRAKDKFMQKLHERVLEKFASDIESAVKRGFSDNLSNSVINNIRSKCSSAQKRVANLENYKGFFQGNADAAKREADAILREIEGLNGIVRNAARGVVGVVASSVGKNKVEIQRFLKDDFDAALSKWKDDIVKLLPGMNCSAGDIEFPTYRIAEAIKELEDSVPEKILNGIKEISINTSETSASLSSEVAKAKTWFSGLSQNELITRLMSDLPRYIDGVQREAERCVDETGKNVKNVINKVRKEIIYGELPQKFFEVRKELFDDEFEIAAKKIKRRMEDSQDELKVIKNRKAANEAEADTMKAEYDAKIAKLNEYRSKIEGI